MKKSNVGKIYIIIAALLWGFFPTLSRLLYGEGVSVMHVIAARAIVAGIIYLIWGLFAGIFKGLKLRDYLFLTAYGIAAILSTYIFYSLAIKYLSSSMAAMLLYTAPAFVIIFESAFYKVKITGVKLAALAAAFIGSCLVVRMYDLNSIMVNGPGIIFGLLSGISYSMLTVIGRKAIERGYSPFQNTFIPSISVGVIMAVAVPPWTIPVESLKIGLLFVAVGVIGSVLPYFFYLKGLSSGTPGSSAVILANIEPVAATLMGVALFHDTLEIWQVLGIAAVLVGAAIPSLAENSAESRKKT